MKEMRRLLNVELAVELLEEMEENGVDAGALSELESEDFDFDDEVCRSVFCFGR